MENLYTLNKIFHDRIPINGKPIQIVTLKKIVIEENVPHAAVSGDRKNSKLYRLEDIEKGQISYNERIHGGKSPKKSNRNLVEEKLTEQIERLKQDQILADLKIKEMQRDLISAEEVRKFLQFRYEVENAILRRILFINAPIEITGLSIPDARKKLETYYNSIQEVMNETLALYEADGEKLENDRINKIIEQLNNALLPTVTENNNQ